jgi:hypothetical protein
MRINNTASLSLFMVLFSGGCLMSGNYATPGTDGGATAVIGPTYFDPDIQASMDIIGCSAQGCHGAGDTPMKVVSPAQGGNADANYAEVVQRTSGGVMSLLLTKPVSGNTVMHEGGKLIDPKSATYQQWLAWVKAGTPLRASGVMRPPAATGSDMATATTPATPPPPTGTGDGGVACDPPKATLMMSHNSGQECLFCHANGTNPDWRWTVAGTLYRDQFGNSVLGGATVRITDAKGIQYVLTTDAQGNFYTTMPVAFPISASASECPATLPMQQKVNNGSCNSAGCHDATRRMYVPHN